MKKKLDILAIDDEQVILDSIQKLCSLEKWHVDTALDVTTALNKMSQTGYELIICDIMLPEIDGFQFLKKAQDMNNQTPIIITSGFASYQNAVKALYNGALDFIPKPFTMDELLSVIQRGFKFHDILRAHNYDIFNPQTGVLPEYSMNPSDYKRLGFSTWAKEQEDGSMRIGACDLYLKTLENITSIDLLEPDEEIFQGSSCAKANTEDEWTHFIPAPLSGRIISLNENILKNIDVFKSAAYTDGWLYSIVPSNLEYETDFLSWEEEN